MNAEDIVRMAREAGFTIGPATSEIYSAPGGFRAELERFAALVAVAAVEREREACAEVCEDKFKEFEFHSNFACASAIRARKD